MGSADARGALRGLEPAQLDDGRATGEHELDRDVDLPDRDLEWIRATRASRADPVSRQAVS